MAHAGLQGVPKVELHVHLDGSFDPGLLYEAAKAKLDTFSDEVASKIAACSSVDDFATLVACTPEDHSLAAMLDRFMFFLPFAQGDLGLLENLARRFVADQAAQNVIYTEVRYSPHVLTKACQVDTLCQECDTGEIPAMEAEARAVVEAVTRGLRRGVAEHPGTEVVQILCFIDARPHWVNSLTTLASDAAAAAAAAPSASLDACPIVGVDIAAGESHFADAQAPLSGKLRNGASHRAGMCQCARSGLGLTNHAGESGPAANVAAAVAASYGAARRVGHGYAAVLDAMALASASGGEPPSPVAALAAFETILGIAPAGVTFEFCPTSSRATNGWAGAEWAEHPAAVLLRLREAAERAGDAATAAALPRATISSDDPAVFLQSLTDEYALAANEMGLGVPALRQLAANAIDGAFVGEAHKKRLHARLETAWEEWRGRPAE